jgi:hemophore-related protein
MFLSGHTGRNVLASVIATGALADTTLFGVASPAFAQPPPPPGCTAGDLAQVSGTVGTAMAGYLFTHPDVNNFFTSLRGLPHEEVRAKVQDYMNANPQVEREVNGLRQPLADLRNRCDAPAPPGSLESP